MLLAANIFFADIGLPLWPDAASVNAGQVDLLYGFTLLVSIFMTVLIFVAVAVAAIKYRRRSENEIPKPIHGSMRLEIAWSIIPFLVMLVFFCWGTYLYFNEYTQPATADAIDVYVVGKQWMWKVQYPEGQREINELHVPIGRKIRLTMASEDVIHSFFVPAFRIKRDVVPGRYNTMWFEATKAGRYHLFCAEYCGTEHSGMVGWVTAMDPAAYQNWLNVGGADGSMASQGEKVFQQHGCSSCHLEDQQGRGPVLRGVYGSSVLLDDGRTVTADPSYIRESILNPNAKIVASFHKDVMPTFQGQVSEEEILQLVAYVKSLSTESVTPAGGQVVPGEGVGMTTIPGRPEANGQAINIAGSGNANGASAKTNANTSGKK